MARLVYLISVFHHSAQGGHADALRKQLTRAIARIGRQLGLEEVSHE